MLVAPALAGCGDRDDAGTLRGDLTLEQAQAFQEFPLVYAGERVDGLPLTAILRREDTASYVSFVYGDCQPFSPDGGCAPPAEIQVWPRSRRGAGSYDASRPGSPAPDNATIRGSPAAFHDAGTRLELYLGRVTVVVFSGSRARLHTIAGALRCLVETAPAAAGDTLDC